MSNLEKGDSVILLVEDSQTLASTYREFLRPDGYRIHHVETGGEALEWLSDNHADIVLLDLVLPDMDGMSVLEELIREESQSRVMIITAHGSVDTAVNAIRSGAADFLEKPFDGARLRTSVRNVLYKSNLESEVQQYRKEFARSSYHGFIGSSLEMQTVYRIIESAAPSKAAVFITGETGTGKEVCAEAVHYESDRSGKAMVPLNCAAIPRELMESEIFGHVKGAFTGANSERQGAAAMANGSTLFLDEICEMDLDLQSKLLRFIQTGTFKKVGSNKLEEVDIRIICATNRDVLAEVKAGRFREDLYYRLHVIPVGLPPLRDRRTDILAIAEKFLLDYSSEEHKDFTGFSEPAKTLVEEYNWPGNVRQLQNVIRNVVVLNNGPLVVGDMLPLELSEPTQGPEPIKELSVSAGASISAASDHSPIQPLWLTEKHHIESAIESCGGNVPKAATLLEVSASTIYRKMQRWEKSDENSTNLALG